MRRRQLGLGGPEISVLGFGAWATGGPWKFGWGHQDDDASIAAIQRAVELGVTWVDTAAVYGWGHSEEVVGQALAGRDDVLVFTKCGLLQGPDGEPIRDLAPANIVSECEASLRRLGRGHIDLYQFHWPDQAGTNVEDSWAAMLSLVEAGKVRWPGVSNFGVDLLTRCESSGHVESLQSPYNLLRTGVEAAELPWCAEHGTGFLAYSPMESGLLSGSFSRERLASLPPDDFRAGSDRFREPWLSAALDTVEDLRPVAAELDVGVAELVIGFALGRPAVTGCIVGARTPEHVDDWIGAGVLDVGPAFQDDLTALALRHSPPAG